MPNFTPLQRSGAEYRLRPEATSRGGLILFTLNVQPSRRFVPNPPPRLALRFECLRDPARLTIRHCYCDVVAFADPPRLDIESDFRLPLALRLESIEHIDNIDHFPKPIRHASGHCRANFQRLMKPNEIEIHRVQRDRARMVFDFLAESICSAGGSPFLPRATAAGSFPLLFWRRFPVLALARGNLDHQLGGLEMSPGRLGCLVISRSPAI